MNRRAEEIKRESEKEMELRIQYSANKILDYFQGHRDELLRETLHQLVSLLKDSSGKETTYLQISYLHTTLLSETYCYLAVLYDSFYYLDLKPVSCQLALNFIYQFFKEDIKYLTGKMEKKFHHLYTSDVMVMKEACNCHYIGIVANYLESVLEEFIETDAYKKMKKQKNFKILFGEYMGKGKVMYELLNRNT